MTSPFIPSSFTYGDAPQGGSVMPMIVVGRDPSDTIDIQYASGYLWLSDLFQGGTGNLFVQVGNSAGLPTWTSVTAGSSGALNTLSDGSTTVSPSGGNIAIVSTANQVVATSSAPAHEIILSLPGVVITPGSLASTTTMTVGTNLTVNGTTTLTGGVTLSGNVTVGGTLGVTGLTTLGALTQVGTASINASGTAATTIGGSSGAITVAVGAGNFSLTGGGNTVGIANDAAANIVTLGSTTGAAALTLQAGTGNFLITGAVTSTYTVGSTTGTGTITLGRSTAGENISIGDAVNASAQTITIANGAAGANSTVSILSGNSTAGTQTFNLGAGTNAATLNIGTGATGVKTIAIGGTAANVVTIANTQTAGSLAIGTAMTGGTISIGGTGLQTGNFDLAPGTGAQAVTLANGGTGVKTVSIATAAVANVVTIGSTTALATLTLQAGSGATGLKLSAAGNVQMVPATNSTASPTAAVTSNNRVGCSTFTGFTTASAASQAFTITNSTVLATSCVFVTVTNLNASTNNAQMSITGVTQAAGSIIVNTKNNGAGALGAGDNVLINYWILS